MSEPKHLQPLVQLEQHNIALLFANYLLTLDIEAYVVTEPVDKDVVQSKQGHTVYCQQDKMEQAKIEFEHFIKSPFDAKYQQAAWQHGETVTLNQQDSTLLSSFKDNFLAHAGIITLLVFAFCWLVFIGSNLGGARPLFTLLQFYPSLSLGTLTTEPWRILSPIFLHFSLLHIVFNTMWWWQLGGSIEKTLGKGILINLLLISAIVSNFGQFFVSGANFGGLSGVVYALVGFVWWYGYLAPEKGLFLSKPIIVFLLFWLILGFADLLPVNVANTAHLLGLISGCLLAVFHVKSDKKTVRKH
ncbi:rhomboid family intramembrane serine protease GlpG [Colwellia sp. MSW7]|uniref:Rhomboid family intramembrane serine protease GlpG n=1 Tax=Colwellia maritima TaxID=2912588 RepID=A0ABS9WX56_9GAMM|nr:rhomboid family intramembrane serine protease GlpG [Colwellia maritima]MCI2282558.1 rhomboid family intramembrane serine protease GlpG [Colwellia maritima]